MLESKNHPAAKAVLLERGGEYVKASNLLLEELKGAADEHESKLKTFVSFATRISERITQGTAKLRKNPSFSRSIVETHRSFLLGY